MENRKNNMLGLVFLGLAPALAATAETKSAFVLALGFFAVLLISSLVMFLLKKVVTDRNTRVIVAVVLTTMLSSVFGLLTEAFAVAVYDSIGLYISLIAVNLLVITLSEKMMDSEWKVSSLFILGLIYAVVIMAVGALREILGLGTFLGNAVPFFADHTIAVFAKAPGAFMAAALVFGLVSFILGKTMKEAK